MKLIVSADNLSLDADGFWLEIVSALKKTGFEVPYWIGLNKPPIMPQDVFFHETVDTYNLVNLYNCKKELFDIGLLTAEEYYNYLKILDRADLLGGYSFSLRDRLLKEQLTYWHSVLVNIKPDCILFSEIPHALNDYPLYLVAKNIEIETIIIRFTGFKGWYYINDGLPSKQVGINLFEINKGDISSLISAFKEQAVIPYEELRHVQPWYMKKQIDYDRQHKKLAVFCKIRLRKHLINLYRWFKGTKHYWQHTFFNFVGADTFFNKVYYKLILRSYKANLRASYEKNTITSEQLSKIERFVFIPLHYQPEATTAPMGGVYSDQIYMIEKLRKAFPSDIALVVKEHYSQFSESNNGFAGRYLGYWDKIADINNTYLVSLDESAKELILRSVAVATVSGTAGWEAIQYGRHCIIFGCPWYESHPSVIKFGESDCGKKIKDICNGVNPAEKTDCFLEKFARCLINNEIHGAYIHDEEEVVRSRDEIVRVVQEFSKNKGLC